MAQLTTNVRIITVTRMLSSTGFSATVPFLALYLAVERSTPLELVGAMYLLQAIAGLVSQIVSGLVSDRIGAKKTYLMGNAFAAAAALYMAALIAIDVSPLVIILTYPAFSLFRGFTIPAGAALIADEKTDMVTNFSVLTMAANLGFSLGPALGGFLVSYTGYGFLFVFSAAMSFVGLGASAILREGTDHLARKKARALPDRSVMAFVLLAFLGYVVIGQDIEPFALYAGNFAGMSNLDIGYIFSFSGLMIVVLQIPLIRLLAGHRKHSLIVGSAAVALLAFGLLFFARTLPDFFASMAVLTLAEILFVVPSQIWITEKAPASRKGAYQGYYGAAMSAGRSSAAWLGSTLQGLFYQATELNWVVMAGLALAMGVGFALHGSPEREKGADGGGTDP
ncbi:MAG: MFS transporter [Nitrososphaerota archaeon]|nr:MFS transporter [Nitrososphaerota archaeon]